MGVAEVIFGMEATVRTRAQKKVMTPGYGIQGHIHVSQCGTVSNVVLSDGENRVFAY